jgi:alkylated DNA repair protein (DNA oxidative demethylase)
MSKVVLEPGLVFLESFLSSADQRDLWQLCQELADGPVPMYTPTLRGGRKMSVRMLSLGKHWNPMTYRYEERRSDFDDLQVPPIPSRFARVAETAAAKAGFTLQPDICIMNYYGSDAKMGVHQDKDERQETIAAGAPIVSVSLGNAARFVIGGLSRHDRTQSIVLRSGDVVVFGGPSRLRYHGITKVLSGTAPVGTGPGRFNLTFRQW